jgi:hypothetical protein
LFSELVRTILRIKYGEDQRENYTVVLPLPERQSATRDVLDNIFWWNSCSLFVFLELSSSVPISITNAPYRRHSRGDI